MVKADGHNEQWKTVKLGDCCTIHGRIGFRGYTTDDLVEKGYGAITFSPSDIHDFKLNFDNCDYISWNKYEESPEIKVFNGDILFCKTASIGKCAIVENLKEKATINPQFVVLKDFVCNPKYLYYKLISYDFQTQVQGITGGSTIKTMSQEKLKLEPILFPVFPDGTHNLPAQRRIAAILSAADKVIEQTRQLIGKYKSIKQGMMEDLLKPKEGWKKVKLGDCIKQKPDYGINAPAVPYDNHLPTYLRITDITEDGYYSKKDIVSVANPEAWKYIMEEGDLVFARTGASVGKTYLYNPNDGVLVFAGFLIRVRTNKDLLLPEFFKYQTQTPQYKNWIAANSMRTGQPGINGNEYEEFSFYMPYNNGVSDIPEQRRIAKILSGIDRKIEAEEKVLEKYEKIKKGLMEKLLKEENKV